MLLMYKRASNTRYIDHTIGIMRRGTVILFRVPNPATNKLTRAPVYKDSVMWNNLPAKTREAGSIIPFKNSYRVHLVIQSQNLAL